MRTQTLWNDGWYFYADTGCGETLPDGPLPWQPVTLPHDWQIWHVQELYQDGTGWYRKKFTWTPGRRCCLYFEGVYMDTAVFVGGRQAIEWKYGYSSFQADVTDFLVPGENEVLVRCRLRHPNSRWYSGAGIYRDVWLLEYPQAHLVNDGLYVSPRETAPGCWQVTVSAEAENVLETDRVELTLLDGDGKSVASALAEPNSDALLAVDHPRLWSLEDPCRYTMRASLLRSGQELDRLETVCGFRTVELSPDGGLLLNHKRVVLHGVCLHHDLGCLGAAFSRPAARRQLTIMQEMGVNALRTSHNMPAPAVMELADEMGILVVDEAFDCWVRSKTPYDYARFFPEWYQKDVASWVRRDRNHPSLLFWSIGNEIYDTHVDAGGMETMQQLLQEVALHDPRKNGLTTFGSNYMAWGNTQKCAPYLDVVGYNYGESLYDEHHKDHPDWVIYGSETASVVQSRGIYHFPLSQPLLVDDDLQCSSLGNSRTSWGAESHQACIASDELYPYNLGQFLWSGIDYIGEPTPYHTKNSYFGLVDTAGFPKDAFYAYQAGWHRWQDRKVLHLLPYWDFNPGQKIDVCVLSNLPQVELLVNGVSQGRKCLAGGSDIQAHWQVPYAPGVIQAIGYDDTGAPVAQETKHSFGDSAALRIHADRAQIAGDGRDLVFCTVTAEDAQGNPVENARDCVRVEVTGPLKLAGLDNGDSTDMDEYKCDCRRLFSGKLLAVVTADGTPGWGAVRVSTPGLKGDSIRVEVTPAAGEVFPVLPEVMEGAAPIVPVRKVELRADAVCLTKEQPQTVVHAAIFPSNAAAEALRWWATDDQGITMTNVVLEPMADGRSVKLTGIGDGAVRIRCQCGPVLSDLEMEVRGLGSLYLTPYEYVSAALFTDSHAEIGNGNERGITFSRTEMSWVAFEQLDFGEAGADTLTIDVFEMCNVPTPIRFWKGIPYAPGSKMIGQRIYDKPSSWNTYKPETFRLDEVLTGQDAFGIELNCKVHIKGFTFHRRSRAWDSIRARAFDAVYGDRFTLTEEAVERIGNNVSLVFRNLDFGTRGFTGIAIRGRSRLENNTIHLRFESEGSHQRRVVEFPGSEEWTEVTFPLEPVYGKQDVTFLFLPGCDFDFMEFRFL
ncbi:MAG: glycoside hydrolase family 2 TIM barrel-domain containing protein [Faecousia sp.]